MRPRPDFARSGWARRVPILLVALLITTVDLQLVWNGTVGWALPHARFRVKFPVGFDFNASPVPTWSNLLDGAYQREAGGRLGRFTMLYTPSLRWRNQLYYSLLNMSGLPTILVGKRQQLFHREFTDEYCRRDTHPIDDRADTDARALRWMQDDFERRGKIFVYVITPSKNAWYPDDLPGAFPCPGRAIADRKLPVWRHALDTAQVRYVDGPALMAEASAREPTTFFPQGGFHWNTLGAAFAARQIVARVNEAGGHLTPFRFTYTITERVPGWDQDLQALLALPLNRTAYPVPVVTTIADMPTDCTTSHVAEVGGSFVFEMNEILESTPCPPEFRTYFYWRQLAVRINRDHLEKRASDAETRRRDLLSWADVILLEENEAAIAGSEHMLALKALQESDAE